MPPEASNALPDPTDPSGTLRPDEPSAKNSAEPPYRPLKISQRVGAPRLPGDLKSGNIRGLIDLFLPQGLLEGICEATNQYAELGPPNASLNGQLLPLGSSEPGWQFISI